MKKFIQNTLRRLRRMGRMFSLAHYKKGNFSFSHGKISDEYTKMAPEISEISMLEDSDLLELELEKEKEEKFDETHSE